MSNKARMSDVFNLPINQNESEFFRNVINMPNCTKAIGQMNSESWARYTVKAINDHDILVEEIKSKDARIAELDIVVEKFRDFAVRQGWEHQLIIMADELLVKGNSK